MNIITAIVALATMSTSPVPISASATPRLEAGNVPLYKAVFEKKGMYEMRFTGDMTVNGFYSAPVAPRLETQPDMTSELFVNGKEVTALGKEPIAPGRSLLFADITNSSKIDVVYRGELIEKRMVPLANGESPQKVEELPASERTRYLESLSFAFRNNEKYEALLKRDGMVRIAGETDRAYALRYLEHMVQTKKFLSGTGGGIRAADVMYERVEGVCNHFSMELVFALRHAGIPARAVCGVLIGSIPHSRVEAWLEGIGWFPIEVSLAVKSKSADRGWGQGYGGFFVLQDDMPLTVPGPKVESKPTQFTGGNIAALVRMGYNGQFAVASYETTWKNLTTVASAAGHD